MVETLVLSASSLVEAVVNGCDVVWTSSMYSKHHVELTMSGQWHGAAQRGRGGTAAAA